MRWRAAVCLLALLAASAGVNAQKKTRLLDVALRTGEPVTLVGLRGDGAIRCNSFYLDHPPRFVCDLVGVTIERSAIVALDTELVHQVRMAQFAQHPRPVGRLVFDLAAPVGVELEPAGSELLLRFLPNWLPEAHRARPGRPEEETTVRAEDALPPALAAEPIDLTENLDGLEELTAPPFGSTDVQPPLAVTAAAASPISEPLPAQGRERLADQLPEPATTQAVAGVVAPVAGPVSAAAPRTSEQAIADHPLVTPFEPLLAESARRRAVAVPNPQTALARVTLPSLPAAAPADALLADLPEVTLEPAPVASSAAAAISGAVASAEPPADTQDGGGEGGSLILLTGERIATPDGWRIDGKRILYRRGDGTLASIRASEVDIERSSAHSAGGSALD